MNFFPLITQSLACTCPRCCIGHLYPSGFDLRLNDRCSTCDLNLAGNDSGDGPAVFLIFILGFLLVPMAIVMEVLVHPPLWVHVVVWGMAALGITFGLLRPIKSLVLLIQYKTRPETWKP